MPHLPTGCKVQPGRIDQIQLTFDKIEEIIGGDLRHLPEAIVLVGQ